MGNQTTNPLLKNPTFKGTRIPVSDVIELLAVGLSIEEIVRDYYPSLSEDMVKEALHWVAKIMRGERYVGDKSIIEVHRYLKAIF
jgi:uncharacterized protein (DUF433 family)